MRRTGAGDGEGAVAKPLFEPGDLVAVLGLGVSGVAAARLLHELGARVYASDAYAAEWPQRNAEALREEGIDAEAGRHDMEKILASRLVVVSPGIDPSTEVRRAVREAELPIVAEVEVAFRHLSSRVIGITGTNGKTTTTALCGHLLETAGMDVLAGGNIGRPLADIARLEEQPEWVVVELSSFQLADLEVFDPHIGVMLNLAPDHLDRYRSLERYYADKARLFANADEDSRWASNADDPAVVEMLKDVPGHHYRASVLGPLERGAYVDDEGWMTLRAAGRQERWARVGELRLLGSHNVMNALLAATAASLAGCPAEAIRRGLRSFEGLPHRLQPVGTWNEVLWVNDSKGTNCSATRVALRSFDRPVVALLGGRHKGEPYGSLAEALQDARAIVTFGEAAPQIVAELKDAVPEIRVIGSIKGLVREAAELARPGDVVLFSPACASYDMFPNYEERGKAFVQAVGELHGGKAGA